MAQNTQRFTSNIKYYTLGVVSTKLLSFIFVPIYSIYILPEALGTYQYIFSIISLCIPILFQDISEGMFRFSILSKGSERDVINQTSKYCLTLSLVYTVLYAIGAFIFKLEYPIWILLSGLSQLGVSYWQYAARALKENKAYTISTIVCSAINILFNIIFIIVLKWQIEALFISSVAGSIFTIVILEVRLHLLKGVRKTEFDWLLLKQIIKYSIPLAINVISWWLTSSCNNIIVTNNLGADANGIMSMANRFSSILVLFTTIITMAWQEESFRTADDKERDVYFNKVLKLYTKSLFSCVLVIIPATYICYKFMIFGDYKTGVGLTAIMYISAAFNAILCHLGSVFLTRGESGTMFWTTLVSGIISVALALLFVKPFGLMGVVIAQMISYIVNFIIRLVMLRTRIDLEFNYFECFVLFAACITVSIGCDKFADNIFVQGIIFAIMAAAAFFYNKSLCVSLIKNFIKR